MKINQISNIQTVLKESDMGHMWTETDFVFFHLQCKHSLGLKLGQEKVAGDMHSSKETPEH